MNTGCYAYKGKSGKDEPGSWRVPNSRELSMILVFAHELERFSSETGFQKLYEAKAANYLSNGYWSSTEQSSTLYSLDKATSGLIDVNYGLTIYEGANKTSTDKNRLRCIKDIPLISNSKANRYFIISLISLPLPYNSAGVDLLEKLIGNFISAF